MYSARVWPGVEVSGLAVDVLAPDIMDNQRQQLETDSTVISLGRCSNFDRNVRLMTTDFFYCNTVMEDIIRIKGAHYNLMEKLKDEIWLVSCAKLSWKSIRFLTFTKYCISTDFTFI